MNQARSARRWTLLAMVTGLMLVLVSACARQPEIELPGGPSETPEVTPTRVATATPAPPDTVIVCLAQEPTSLYFYGDTNRAADAVLDVVYDGPVDLVDYRYQPSILEKVPRLEDADAVVEPVSIASGDVYLNPDTLEPDTLARGKPYAPTGCRGGECITTYEGGAVEVDRMRVTYRLSPGTLWSDGEPLRASDSVFSFEIDGDPDTPTPKYIYARTFSYRALDELAVEWTGIPGFLDAEYPSNFWSPLPEHQLGDLEPGELLESQAAARTPLGWGPYQVSEWRQDAEIRLERNTYYRTDTGTPAFESVVFRFVEPGPSALEQLQTGECDVLDEALLPSVEVASLISRAQAGDYELSGVAGPAVERLDFNVHPVEGQSLFADVRARRGLAACLDRSAIADAVAGGYTSVPATYLPISHPLYDPGEDPVAFDLTEAERNLREAGWIFAEEGTEVRSASGVEGVSDGTPLAFDLYVLRGEISEQVGADIVEDMQACGAEATLRPLPADELFAGWPEGPVFGRRFGAVVWAWPTFASPSCEMFAGWEVPSDERPLGINASGYTGSSYASACRSMLLSPPDTPAFLEAVRTIQSEFVRDVPGVPIYQRPRIVAHAPWLCEVEIDGSAVTAYGTIERWRPCPANGAASE